MVLWVRKHPRLSFLAVSLITAGIFCFPYLIRDLLPVEHDTFFHLSRIEGLAQSIRNGDYLPALYSYKNGGFGYASPLFYCDVLLYPYALLYLAGMPLTICYKLMIFADTWLGAWTMMLCTYRISDSVTAAMLSGIGITFANYRITDVYVRGAVGEVQAFVFLPLVIEGMYAVLYEEKTNDWYILTIGLAGVLCSHNITFLMTVVLCIILFLSGWKHIQKKTFLYTAAAVFTAFLLTVFFSLPMEEQLHSGRFYLNYYGENSDLAAGALPLWKYFANRTVFGYSDNSLPHDEQMLVNPGWFLLFGSLIWLFFRKKENKPFVTVCLILGIAGALICGAWFPWAAVKRLRIMQFPWRLMEISTVLTAIPAGIGAACLFRKKRILSVLAACVLYTEGIYHVYPVLTRTFGMTSDMTWQDVLAGKLCDPYYSAFYVRVELAGGDYLPMPSPDYRKISADIMRSDYSVMDVPYEKQGTKITFSLSEDTDGEAVVLPLTYYKGYHVYCDGREISCQKDARGLVTFTSDGAGSYTCVYESTPLRKACTGISGAALAAFAVYLIHRAHKKPKHAE